MAANYYKERREELGITQQSVADALNIKVPAVSAWERGIASPDIDHVPALAKVYQVSESRLFREIQISRAARPRRRVPA